MTPRRGLFLGLLLFFLTAMTLAGAENRLLVSAASSLAEVLESLAPEASKASGLPVLLNTGASGSLRTQIMAGAPVDVFIAADPSDIDALAADGLVVPASIRIFLGNSLVLIGEAGKGRGAEPRVLLSEARLLAIGNPETVPVGRYARQALGSLGLWELVAGKLLLGGSARQVLEYVKSGSVPLGVVFSTDARGAGVDILYSFPESSMTTPPRYAMAVIASSRHRDAALRFEAFLLGPASRKAFSSRGFVLP
jgi:molybdate transport system substrate-binding protein